MDLNLRESTFIIQLFSFEDNLYVTGFFLGYKKLVVTKTFSLDGEIIFGLENILDLILLL